jgi:SAM-dependent methyltransferase
MEAANLSDSYVKNNVERFSGFEACYDENRPEAPRTVVEIAVQYLGRRPALVMDLGCGTGLSTFVWKDDADRIIGVEPNDDMRGRAEEKKARASGVGHIIFRKGYSNDLDVDSGTVDVITCSQSFHWMEPESTLREAHRALADGGVFMAYDCDWPPVVGWPLEAAYERLIAKADALVEKLAKPEDRARKWNKEEHLKRMRASEAFRFTREIVFHHPETFDAQRLVSLAISQGGVQTVRKLGSDELEPEIEAFRQAAERYFGGGTRDVLFGYRLRLGVK